jgi:pimeloyl-ACP methyl ester carboxylesterase
MQQGWEGDPSDSTPFEPGNKMKHVLFIHGLFLRGYEAMWLARNLRRNGLYPERFRYASRGESPARVAARLAEVLRQMPELNIIAHSLGGLITLAALAEVASLWQGRAVLLGSPLAGSACARRVASLWGGEWLLGAAREWLCNGLAPMRVPDDRVAILAGTCNRSVGCLLGACPRSGDGIVRVAETRFEGVLPMARVNTTHLGLLFDRQVAVVAARFIRTGTVPCLSSRTSGDLRAGG